MNTNDLYLEYARVIQMCKNTELEDTPWVCVRWRKEDEQDWRYFSGGHPVFGFFKFGCIVESAVAVLEGKPVFVGDRLWLKDGHQFAVEDDLHIDHKIMSWTPPTPKRTFTLNGVELPCPVDRDTGVWTGRIFDRTFNFDTLKEKELVRDSFINLLIEARDK